MAFGAWDIAMLLSAINLATVALLRPLKRSMAGKHSEESEDPELKA